MIGSHAVMVSVETTATKHAGFLPHPMRPIERNIQNAFARYRDSTGRIFWIYLPHKTSTLSARVYADTIGRRIVVSVYEQDQQDPSSTTKGTSINQWSTILTMDDEWERKLAEAAGRAMKQAEKQPKCLCGGSLFIRDHGCQIFACAHSPGCSHVAEIKDYGYSFG